MDFKVEKGRIWLPGPDGQLLAEVLFPDDPDGVPNITHTFVDPSLRGQGVAGKLMQAAVAELRRQRHKTRLTCSYAVVWFPKHPEYNDVLA